MHNIDLPTRDELTRIAGIREPGSVTIYVPTSIELNESDKARIEVKSRLREAVAQLEAASTDAAIIDSITNAVDELLTDGDFWRRQSNSLAIFVTRLTLSTFRVGNKLIGLTDVSAFVLALSQNSVRLIDVSPALRASEAPILDAVHAKELATQVARFEEASSPDLTDSTLSGVAFAAASKDRHPLRRYRPPHPRLRRRVERCHHPEQDGRCLRLRHGR